MEKISYIFLLFVIYSICGWIIEVTLKLFTERKFINRGFFIGPYCPIYGVGALLVINLLTRFLGRPLIVFLLSVLICSIVEYSTSFILEKLFNTSWWDYSDEKFNINGRICLETMLLFGLGCLFVLYVVNPFINKLLLKIPSNILVIIAIVIFVIILTDVIISLIIIIKFSKISENSKSDSTEIVTRYVRNAIIKTGKVLYIRFINAFPNFKIIRKKRQK
jgi:uncharacterized membrane protein